MGADFLMSVIPACHLDETRLGILKELAKTSEPDGSYDDEDPTDWPEQVINAIARVDCEYRDVGTLDLCGWPYPILVSGGMSWGDDPTESYHAFSVIGCCPEIWNKLEEWAKEDKDE